jgi:hypothetical protein
MDYRDDYDEYDDYEDYEDQAGYDDPGADTAYYRDPPAARRTKRQPGAPAIVQQALDWGISGSILAILVLTAIYLFSPVDLIPDLIPVAGQADDLAAVLAGSGSVAFLTIMRFVLRTRVGRWGCLIAIFLTAIGAFAVFWVLMSILDSIL